MLIGFALAAYSIVANDSIQTLGTFLSSNAKRPWWVLWLWIALILVVTVVWGWLVHAGDPAFGRLQQKGINFPAQFSWLYVIPPLVLVMLTRAGIPVSTSLLVLTSFVALSSLESGSEVSGPGEIFANMMKKSFVGYLLAFGIGLAAYGIVISLLERGFESSPDSEKPVSMTWVVFQWVSTGFLWSMWLVQDLANVFVYLPRKLDLVSVLSAVGGMVLLLAIIIRARGGRIQQVVTEKTNTVDIRSATLIDFFYAMILMFFKVDYIPKLFLWLDWDIPWPEKMPMSTTWVFLGLLAGREFGMWFRLRNSPFDDVRKTVGKDLLKVSLGAVISLVIAFALPYLAIRFGLVGVEPVSP